MNEAQIDRWIILINTDSFKKSLLIGLQILLRKMKIF